MLLETGHQQEKGIADPWRDARAAIRARYGGAPKKVINAWVRAASDFELRRPVLAWFFSLGVSELAASKVAASLTRKQLEDLTALGLGAGTKARLTTQRGVMIALALQQPNCDGPLRTGAVQSAATRAAQVEEA